LGVNIGVFWKREWRPSEWRQCRLSTPRLFFVCTSIVYEEIMIGATPMPQSASLKLKSLLRYPSPMCSQSPSCDVFELWIFWNWFFQGTWFFFHKEKEQKIRIHDHRFTRLLQYFDAKRWLSGKCILNNDHQSK
jgi:hypothetical protein